MQVEITPTMIVSAFVMGGVSAYLAKQRKKNPYLWFFLGFGFGVFGIFSLFFVGGRKKAPEKKIPTYYIDGPSDKLWYYLDEGHERQGPMSLNALSNAWKEGKVGKTNFVWNEEMSDWTPLKEILKVE